MLVVERPRISPTAAMCRYERSRRSVEVRFDAMVNFGLAPNDSGADDVGKDSLDGMALHH